MKILIRNSDNVAMYADDSLELSDDGVKGSGWVDYNFTSANATLVDATLPPNWTGLAYAYADSDWVVFDQAILDDRAAYKAQRDTEQAASVRASRTEKLKDCDWTQISDSTADKATWATYRQALRDISAQAGFPWTVVWPTQPV